MSKPQSKVDLILTNKLIGYWAQVKSSLSRTLGDVVVVVVVGRGDSTRAGRVEGRMDGLRHYYD